MRGVAEIKSILWILAMLRGVYGVMGPSKLYVSISGSVVECLPATQAAQVQFMVDASILKSNFTSIHFHSFSRCPVFSERNMLN